MAENTGEAGRGKLVQGVGIGHKGNKTRCGHFPTYTPKPRKKKQGPRPRWALVQQAMISNVGKAGVWQYD